MLSADTQWFSINLNNDLDFSVYMFKGRERASAPYEFQVEMVHLSSDLDLADYIGKPALLTIADKFGIVRPVHGLVRQMEQLHSTGAFTHYRCIIVPRFWFLGENRNQRIFQNKTVVEIIEEILSQQHGFSGSSYEFRCAAPEAREYCVQYGESDLYFISRLCEEEGIYYFFEHSLQEHRIVFSDRPGGPAIEGRNALRFFPGSGQTADETIVTRAYLRQTSGSDDASYRDWNFTKPSLKSLPVNAGGNRDFGPAPSGMSLEVYKYPHIYQLKEEGKRYAGIQLDRQFSMEKCLDGQGDAVHLVPGHVFTLHSHHRQDLNADWWLYSVEQKGEQPQVLKHEAPDRGMTYTAKFTAIPAQTRFVPEAEHPKMLVQARQTAIVTGPEGEEIYPDEYGRVKVQFFWDRLDQYNDKSSCWLRVSQGWAGSEYGSMAIPRIDQEVIVSFLEGDPDRPIVTGRVYNDAQMPPYELPAHKTRSVFKSMSTPGGKKAERGYNELRIEDKAGEEEIFLHAEKDVNSHTKNDWKDNVLATRHRTVDGTTYASTEGETHEKLQKPRKTELFAQDNLTVHADGHFEIKGKWLGDAGSEIHLDAGMKVVIEAGTEITLKGGGSFAKVDPAGVHFGGGSVNLSGGSGPGSGSGANPLLPVEAKPTESGICPTCMAALQEAEKLDAPFSGTCAGC